VREGALAVDEGMPPRTLGPRAWRRLGRFQKPVQAQVRRVNKIRWLERGGLAEQWDGEVVRIWHYEDAEQISRGFMPVREAVWTALGEIGQSVGRFGAMQAAEEYWIARFKPQPRDRRGYIDELYPSIDSAIVGSLREIVLDDVVSVRFFREAIDWYEKGHWLCAIDEHGQRLVY